MTAIGVRAPHGIVPCMKAIELAADPVTMKATFVSGQEMLPICYELKD